MKMVQFGRATVNPMLQYNQPTEASQIETALKQPANKALVDLLEALNPDEGGTHVVFYEVGATSVGAFLTDVYQPEVIRPGVIRADVVTGSGAKFRILRSAIGPDVRYKRGSLVDRLVGGEVSLKDFVAKALATAFQEGSYEESRKEAAAKALKK